MHGNLNDDIRPIIDAKPVKFMDKLRVFIRSRHLAYSTEKTYCLWVADYIRFHKYAEPSSLCSEDIDAYLSSLSANRNVSGNTQKTALNAIVFMYTQFLKLTFGKLDFVPSSRPKTFPRPAK